MKCCIPNCSEPAFVPLWGTGYPPAAKHPDEGFVFCVEHAWEYQQRGYSATAPRTPAA